MSTIALPASASIDSSSSAPGPGGAPPAIELRWATLADVTGGSSALLREIVAEYVEMSEALLASMKEALEKGDGGALSRAAHSLKGSSGMIGALSVMRSSLDVERAAMSGDLDRARNALTRLCRDNASTVESLESPPDPLPA